jgi:hypothetical protein
MRLPKTAIVSQQLKQGPNFGFKPLFALTVKVKPNRFAAAANTGNCLNLGFGASRL